MAKNIVFYFSDQQRWDTVNEELTPRLTELAKDGVCFESNYTCQPVCGPARACLQTGQYAERVGCHRNGIPLPKDIKPLAAYFNEAGYETAYIGKWHLASGLLPGDFHCETTAVPKDRQGQYGYWRAADVLEFTSHGYDGYVFDGDGNKLEFKGYRADCINDYALEFLDRRDESKPFFLFISQLEPHHQNDRHRFEGYRETVDNFRSYPLPDDLTALNGDYREMWPDYLSAINRLDYNVGRLIDKLKQKGLYDDTVIIYTSDHGCHFKTRNMEYKRSCHESCTHTPLIIHGGQFTGGKKVTGLTSLIDIPPTLLSLAGIDVPDSYDGRSLTNKAYRRESVFMQISESQCGRAVRTDRWKYSVRSPGVSSCIRSSSAVYIDDFLYDEKNDPNELHNLIRDRNYDSVRLKMRSILLKEMQRAGESRPVIFSRLKLIR